MNLYDLDTPALVIALDVMERNLQRMADYATAHRLNLRPHTKTHKIPALGQRQVALGAVGLTVAKPGEAEVMLAAHAPEILVAYPTIGATKLARLTEVAKRTKLLMSLDSIEVAQQLSAAADAAKVDIGVLTEIDVGLGRVGVAPGPHLIELIQAVERLPGISWQGLAFYPGHIKGLDTAGLAAIDGVSQLLGDTIEELKRRGFAPRIVSGGSTPAWEHSHRMAGMTEMRPGTYIFNDRNSSSIGSCTPADCAASLIVTVVSTAVPGQVIIDGGSKTFSSDRLATGGDGFGAIDGLPDAVFTKMNEEHGFVDISRTGKSFRVGDKLRIIPNHVCVAVNLHEQIYGVRNETVETTWKVEGRGKLQ